MNNICPSYGLHFTDSPTPNANMTTKKSVKDIDGTKYAAYHCFEF